MERSDEIYKAYLSILKEELVPAMGCTEPIAIAFAAARAREILGSRPQRVSIEASRNLIKNVKSVVVPNTGNLRGIEASAAAGIVAGKPDRKLEVISSLSDQDLYEVRRFIEETEIIVREAKSDLALDLVVSVFTGDDSASVRISHFHTNIVQIRKNGKVIFGCPVCVEVETEAKTDRSVLNVNDILEFAKAVDIGEVEGLLQRQIDYNMAIAGEGLKGDWGANIGSVLIDSWGHDVKVLAKAMAAAGSDARMSGCSMPAVIVSGSGNQGITASVPVIVYARELEVQRETLLRALVVSNLVTIHLKTGIGSLSAFCGVVSAGCGAGAGIAWLHGGGFEDVAHTIVNALAMVSGIFCDGAKPACAGKIAASVDAGILGFLMYQRGQEFYAGEGIVSKGVENTIRNIGRLGREGMRETDREIMRIMLDKDDPQT